MIGSYNRVEFRNVVIYSRDTELSLNRCKPNFTCTENLFTHTLLSRLAADVVVDDSDCPDEVCVKSAL